MNDEIEHDILCYMRPTTKIQSQPKFNPISMRAHQNSTQPTCDTQKWYPIHVQPKIQFNLQERPTKIQPMHRAHQNSTQLTSDPSKFNQIYVRSTKIHYNLHGTHQNSIQSAKAMPKVNPSIWDRKKEPNLHRTNKKSTQSTFKGPLKFQPSNAGPLKFSSIYVGPTKSAPNLCRTNQNLTHPTWDKLESTNLHGLLKAQ